MDKDVFSKQIGELLIEGKIIGGKGQLVVTYDTPAEIEKLDNGSTNSIVHSVLDLVKGILAK